MNQVCRAYPHEWCSLVDSLEYLYDTEPQGDFGLSAHDMATGYALVGEVDQRLAPFMIPTGTAQTELAARVFDRFRGLYGIYSRSVRHKAKQAEDVVNRRRNLRVFDVGENIPEEARVCEAAEATHGGPRYGSVRSGGAKNEQ